MTNSDGFLAVNTSWKSFKADGDILLNGSSINKIGERYFADPAEKVTKGQSTTGPGGVTVNLGSYRIPLQAVRQSVAGLVALDFSDLKSPVSNWKESRDLVHTTTSYRLDLGLRTILSIAPFISETPTTQFHFPHTLTAELNAEFITNGLTTSKGDMLIVDSGTTRAPVLMTGTIGIIVAALLSSYLLERRMSARSFRKSKRSR
jgi:hypothetical protein